MSSRCCRAASGACSSTTIDDVAPIMRQAIVSVEDQRFYEHSGVDIRASGARSGRTSGTAGRRGRFDDHAAVRQARLRPERAHARSQGARSRARLAAEQRWSKDRILVAYLNTIYFGNGAYGIQQAARTYFNKGARTCQLHEAALLAGLPADPSAYDPVRHPATRGSGATTCSRRMADQGRIGPSRRCRQRTRSRCPKPARRPPARAPAAPLRTSSTTSPTSCPALRRRARVRRRSPRVRRRSTSTCRRRRGGRSRRCCRIRRALPPRSSRSIPRDGSVKAMFGGSSFRREPVQPGHAGRAPARLRVQADRARGGVSAGHLAARPSSSRSRSRSTPATASGRCATTRGLPRAGSTSPRRWCTPTTRSTPS